MLRTDAKALKPFALAAALVCLLLAAPRPARAQSPDPNFPSPVFTNEVSGRIAPRDIGDPRRTRHFYTFRGIEGDLVVTLESTELTGDVDLFTASTQRPLLKFTLYGGSAAKASKSVYLRAEQLLVLRVEARAAGDAEGSYRIRFEGAFAPAPAGLADAPPPPTLAEPDAERRPPGTRRVTSTGARIEEPRVETAAKEEEPAPTPTPTPEPTETTTRPPRRESTPRRGRSRAPNRRQTTPAPSTSTPAETARTDEGTESPPSTTPPAETPEAEKPEATPPNRNARRRGSRSNRRGAAANDEKAAAEPATPTTETPTEPAPAPPGQRLVIITKDGTILVRQMSLVRRVTVDNNQLVVLLKDGKVIRHPLTDVERMSIEP